MIALLDAQQPTDTMVEEEQWFEEMDLPQIARPRPVVRALKFAVIWLIPVAGIAVAISIHRLIRPAPPGASKAVAVADTVGGGVGSVRELQQPAAPGVVTRSAEPDKTPASKGAASPRTARKAPSSTTRLGATSSSQPRRPSRSRQLRLARYVKEARGAYARRQWKRALQRARLALRIERGNRKALAIKKAAEKRIAHQSRVIKRHLQRAHQDLKVKNYKSARRRAGAVLKLDPHNRTAQKIKRRAEYWLRRRRG
jgi:hypothetical protein